MPTPNSGADSRGKSYLARLLASLQVDVSNSARDTVPTGIHIWGEPLPLAQGGFWLVIDTEGTDRGSDALMAQLTGVMAVTESPRPSDLLALKYDGGKQRRRIQRLQQKLRSKR
jgi:hypothetical protein